jgi:bud site selection protein 31
VKTGCISCTSGDGQNGGPIWWNTPITEEIQTKVMKKKKAAKAAGKDADEMDPEVKARLAALKGAN